METNVPLLHNELFPTIIFSILLIYPYQNLIMAPPATEALDLDALHRFLFNTVSYDPLEHLDAFLIIRHIHDY